MHEKWEQSDLISFDIKAMVKSNAITPTPWLIPGAPQRVRPAIPRQHMEDGMSTTTFFYYRKIFTIIFVSKPLKPEGPHFSCITFFLQLVSLVWQLFDRKEPCLNANSIGNSHKLDSRQFYFRQATCYHNRLGSRALVDMQNYNITIILVTHTKACILLRPFDFLVARNNI